MRKAVGCLPLGLTSGLKHRGGLSKPFFVEGQTLDVGFEMVSGVLPGERLRTLIVEDLETEEALAERVDTRKVGGRQRLTMEDGEVQRAPSGPWLSQLLCVGKWTVVTRESWILMRDGEVLG